MADFMEKRSFYYPLLFTLPEAAGGSIELTVQSTGETFESYFMTWDQGRMMPDVPLMDDSIPPVLIATIGLGQSGIPTRDGQFLVEIRTGSKLYQSSPVMVRNIAGEPCSGRPIPFPEPIRLTIHDSLTVRLTNLIDRTGHTAQDRRVEICFVGVTGLPIARG